MNIFTNKENVDDIKENTQALFFSKKNLGALVIIFLIPRTFVEPGENSNGHSSDLSNNLS